MPSTKLGRYKRPKTVLKHTLEFFRANPKNWTTGQYRLQRRGADGGFARCAIGGVFDYSDNTKVSNDALRLLAEALGMKNAQVARMDSVKNFIFGHNDHRGGRIKILTALERAGEREGP